MNLPIFRHLIFVAGVGIATSAGAQSFQDLGEIEARVVAALGAGIGEPGGPARPVDRRLRLAACPEPLTVDEPALGAIAVRCPSLNWRIRVPITQGGAAGRVADSGADSGPREVPQVERSVERAARAAPVIRRGDPVALVVQTGSFTVSRQAVAEQDGAPGQRIRVRTEPRAQPIVGQVLADGRVLMSGFN
jgi:flagella basal body P-ring formation protein FlgA